MARPAETLMPLDAKIVATTPAVRIERLRRDDDAARSRFMESLYRSCWHELCRRLRTLYGAGPPEPEDIAQTAFAKLAALDDYERIDNPRAFLFATAINTALTAIDRIVHARRIIEVELHASGSAVEEITPARVLEAKEQVQVLERTIARLSQRQREILIRSRLKGETFAQIAAATGWSQPTISRELRAVLATLQQALDDSDCPHPLATGTGLP